MACAACERRRVIMAVMAAAGQKWVKNPTGPSLVKITEQMLAEARASGELKDDT